MREKDWFVDSGRRSVQDFERALGLITKSIKDYPRVLDFGCGAGRILLHLEEAGRVVELHGCDIDAEAIKWAQTNVPWARCIVNPYLPPSEYPDAFFDLILNHSVFSHLDERYQGAWLAELARIIQPGGTALLSVNGTHAFEGFEKSWREAGADPTPLREKLRREGILYIVEDSWKAGPFPDFYHSTFHAPWYVFEHWSRCFDIKAYIPRGALDFQDLVLLQKRS
ncbi:MAG TPA: class I SAM-dependent methyltransferase [Thermoanaerobaculia bacterium]